MDATNQNPEQVRSVKRKYVRKSVEGADAVEAVSKEKTSYGTSAISPQDLPGANYKASEYACRVWNGQSPDLPIAERVSRVIAALKGQNLLTSGVSGVVLPDAEATRHLGAIEWQS